MLYEVITSLTPEGKLATHLNDLTTTPLVAQDVIITPDDWYHVGVASPSGFLWTFAPSCNKQFKPQSYNFV